MRLERQNTYTVLVRPVRPVRPSGVRPVSADPADLGELSRKIKLGAYGRIGETATNHLVDGGGLYACKMQRKAALIVVLLLRGDKRVVYHCS